MSNRKADLCHLLVELFLENVGSPAAQTLLHHRASILDGVGCNVLEVGTVCNVNVDKELRHPAIVELQPRAHLRSVGLQEVAVEVEELRCVACSQLLGAILVDAVGGAEILVSIDVEYGNHQKTHVVQQLHILAVHHHITQHNHRRILTVGLARMYARLDENYGATLATNLVRRGETILIYNHKREVASLRTCAERLDVYHLRVVGQLVEECHRLIEMGSLYKVGEFAIGNKLLGRGLALATDAERECQCAAE